MRSNVPGCNGGRRDWGSCIFGFTLAAFWKKSRREADASQTRGDCSFPWTTVFNGSEIDHDSIAEVDIDRILYSNYPILQDDRSLVQLPTAIDY